MIFRPFGSRPPHPRPPSACAWRERRDRTTGARLRPLDSSRARGHACAWHAAAAICPRLHALSLSFFGHIGHIHCRPHTAIFLAYSAITIAQHSAARHAAHGPAYAPPRPSCAATATAAAAMCSLWLLIDRALPDRRAGCHILGPKAFSHRIFCMAFVFKTWRAAVRHDAGRGGTF